MGLSIGLHVFQNRKKQAFQDFYREIFQGLEFKIISEELQHGKDLVDDLYGVVLSDHSGKLYAITEKGDLMIIIDQAWEMIAEGRITTLMNFTNEEGISEYIFSTMGSDTVALEMNYLFAKGKKIEDDRLIDEIMSEIRFGYDEFYKLPWTIVKIE